jgi:hypothetical protein
MDIILAIDALEHSKVEEYNCVNLKQKYYGKTNISEFSQPRTMVLWSSFMTGMNKEKEVLSEGNKEMWNKKWDINETFFSKYKTPKVIDLPGFSYDLKVHEDSRVLLKKFFEVESDEEKNEVRKEYNKEAFEHHKKIKKEFLEAISSGEHDLVLGYFSVGDVIGHLNFGNRLLMKMIYKDFDELAKVCAEKGDRLLVISDHGMYLIGNMLGDHSTYGFWSTNFKDLGQPKITEINNIFF